jgi:hypothetical protein
LRVIRAYRDDQKNCRLGTFRTVLLIFLKRQGADGHWAGGCGKITEQLEAKPPTSRPLVHQHGNRSHVAGALVTLVSFESHYETPRPLPSSKDKKKGSSCVLTLKDIVEVLSRPATTLSRVPCTSTRRETPSEKSSSRARTKDLVPDWIHFVDKENDKTVSQGYHCLALNLLTIKACVRV